MASLRERGTGECTVRFSWEFRIANQNMLSSSAAFDLSQLFKKQTRHTKMIKQVQAPKQMQASKQVQRIPYVAAKVAVVKNNQVATKVKDGITEGNLSQF